MSACEWRTSPARNSAYTGAFSYDTPCPASVRRRCSNSSVSVVRALYATL
ncbi:Uncharacterised protein [Bordetella pertussis]|nr:Uncharacterised protein [Bordetella pertussis]